MVTILLIDDSEALLQHVAAMLVAGGHKVVPMASSRDALVHLANHAVDLVITDMYMPPPDGFEVLAAAVTHRPRIPVIVMSTNPLACDVFRAARALGAVAALKKPFTADELLHAVAGVLPGHAAARETDPRARLAS